MGRPAHAGLPSTNNGHALESTPARDVACASEFSAISPRITHAVQSTVWRSSLSSVARRGNTSNAEVPAKIESNTSRIVAGAAIVFSIGDPRGSQEGRARVRPTEKERGTREPAPGAL